MSKKTLLAQKELHSLYMHFPFCRHLCNYCDFYKALPQSSEDIEQFHAFLTASWKEHQTWLESLERYWGPLQTFYLGGGTPSLWGTQGAEFLKRFFAEREITLHPEGEHTMEMNPGTYTPEGVRAWMDFGMNRFSLGLQALDGDFLSDLDRVHSLEESFCALEFLSSLKSEGIHFSVDFMLGLPFSSQRKRDVLRELEQVLEYSPTHISLYILTVKGAYLLYHKLPGDQWIAREYLKVSEFLCKRGFEHYEVSNFALPGRESRHNLRYWTSQTTAALGRSATGFLSEEGIRYKWRVRGKGFSTEVLDSKSLNLERIYLGLRLNSGLELSKVFVPQERKIVIECAKIWESRGLASYENGIVKLRPHGFLLLDSLMGELFKAQSQVANSSALT